MPMRQAVALTLAISTLFLCVACGGGSSSSSNNPPPPNPTPSAAPSWTLVGNTGLVQTWGILFDKARNMYAAANNSTTGGLARSTDKGKTWSPIMTGIDLSAGCPSFRSLGLAPDGTVFTINQACGGQQHFAYWLDNVS